VRFRRQLDADRVAGSHLAAGQYDRHDPGLSDDLAAPVVL
jgi:hypothetical protein